MGLSQVLIGACSSCPKGMGDRKSHNGSVHKRSEDIPLSNLRLGKCVIFNEKCPLALGLVATPGQTNSFMGVSDLSYRNFLTSISFRKLERIMAGQNWTVILPLKGYSSAHPKQNEPLTPTHTPVRTVIFARKDPPGPQICSQKNIQFTLCLRWLNPMSDDFCFPPLSDYFQLFCFFVTSIPVPCVSVSCFPDFFLPIFVWF